MNEVLVGTAGWSADRKNPLFAGDGTALERYAAHFSAVEVNSSFYRRHRAATWQRWHDAVPQDFRFSVKLPKSITHEGRLLDPEQELEHFLSDVEPLAGKLAAILIQLPPKLAFEADTAKAFFQALRARCNSPVFIEPRHTSWADPEASALLTEFAIGRVYADPQKDELRRAALESKTAYLRLHGSPKIYYSSYGLESLVEYREVLRASGEQSWCIFDNTASGAALENAVEMLELLSARCVTD